MTADCLPVVLADRGWHARRAWPMPVGADCSAASSRRRSPHSAAPARDLHAWLGPAIGPEAFEVGAEVREAYVRRCPGQRGLLPAATSAVATSPTCTGSRGSRSSTAGRDAVHGGGWCTHRDRERFFSFRRDGVTGRMATLAWLA